MMRLSSIQRSAHAFLRPPHHRAIPSTGPNGVVVNREMLVHQFRDFYRTLQQSTIIDKLHVMAERPGFESVRASDQLSCVGSTYLAMPMIGQEQRSTEFMETMRYVRAAGGPASLATYLQDSDACRCHSGDIVTLPSGIALGHGPRTNAAAHQTMKSLFEIKDDVAPFDVVTLEQEGDAPPLGDYFGFSGNDVLVAWKDEHGMLAVDQYLQQRAPGQPNLQTVYLEPGCHFFSFYGTDVTNDILVQKGYERSMDLLSAAGLNPIPVQWSEMDKMGISMRSAVLVMKFVKSNPGGMLTRVKPRGTRWQSHQLQPSS